METLWKGLPEVLEIRSNLQDNMIMDQTSTHTFREILSGQHNNYICVDLKPSSLNQMESHPRIPHFKYVLIP